MREYSTPLTVPVPTSGSLSDDVVRNGEEHPDSVAFSRPTPDDPGRTWTPVTAAEFLAEVRAVAKGLVASGIEPGDRVVLLARTRYEWTLMDYALWYAGAVPVPVYETSAPEQVAWILRDSGARAAVVDGPVHAERVRRAAGTAVLRHVWELDGDPAAAAGLAAAGAHVPDELLESRRAALTPDTLATIIYTSGTTGQPKGCALTHGNFMFELAVAVHELEALFADPDDDAATLLVLPLAHVFARIIQVGAVRARVRLGHVEDVRHLLGDLREFAPTFLLGVPRVFERIFNVASQRAAAEGRGKVFDRATDVAIAWSTALDRTSTRPSTRASTRASTRTSARAGRPGGGRPGLLVRTQHALLDRSVYAGLRAALGGRCRFAVSGGAPLGERLGHFYRGIGIPVLEGYGLTETTGAVTVNLPDALRIGSVGRPLPGTTVRVAQDGELLVRGGQVMGGYWNDGAATREVLTGDGWLRTGDLGEIDDEGFLRVTGRKKEIIVTAGGKNIAPGMLEDRLRAHPLVGQCLVVGDGRPYAAALITLDLEMAGQWARTQGKDDRAERLARDPDLLAELQSAVDDTNRTVSQAESIRRFTVLATEWTDETGELTPSLKLRRNAVLRRYRAEIEALYDH